MNDDLPAANRCILVMGVSGSGKTTIGMMLAKSIHGNFLDADDLHPASNIEKMARGLPLTDFDRGPWLKRVASAIRRHDGTGPLVVACSALKSSYRDSIGRDLYTLIYLKGSMPLIAERMAKRENHFMPLSLLESQFLDLEEPSDALTIPASEPPDEIVGIIQRSL